MKELDAIRRKLKRHTVRVAHSMTGIPVRTLQRFMNDGMTPRYETMVKLTKWAKGVR